MASKRATISTQQIRAVLRRMQCQHCAARAEQVLPRWLAWVRAGGVGESSEVQDVVANTAILAHLKAAHVASESAGVGQAGGESESEGGATTIDDTREQVIVVADNVGFDWAGLYHFLETESQQPGIVVNNVATLDAVGESLASLPVCVCVPMLAALTLVQPPTHSRGHEGEGW